MFDVTLSLDQAKATGSTRSTCRFPQLNSGDGKVRMHDPDDALFFVPIQSHVGERRNMRGEQGTCPRRKVRRRISVETGKISTRKGKRKSSHDSKGTT